MNEEEIMLSGKSYDPGDSYLKKIKQDAHNLCNKYNRLYEKNEKKNGKRNKLVEKLFLKVGKNFYLQNPIQIHYGNHTIIGDNFFSNFNLTIQDDAMVTIGNNCSFGPNVTIVTPNHPLIAEERRGFLIPETSKKKYCYAKSVSIGDNCWLGANVTVCPGVSIGDNVVIGAGSVVVSDISENTIAVGVPCKVLRKINSNDSVYLKEGLF